MKHINDLDTINEKELEKEGIEQCEKYCKEYCFDHGFGYCPNCAYYKVKTGETDEHTEKARDTQ